MKEFSFYGVCGNEFKLDDTVWEAMEDESDGYRSYLANIEKVNSEGIFSKIPLTTVKVEKDDDFYKLIDVEDGHCWLRIGTDHTDYYYPYFVFDYEPKGNNESTYNNEDSFDNFIM